jgi:hypothetical protein
MHNFIFTYIAIYMNDMYDERVRHELKCREVKTGFCRKRDKCKPVLLRLSLAGNLEKPLVSLYGTEWRERGFGLRS